MKAFYYLGVFLFGFLGLGHLLSAIELLVFRGRFAPVSFLLAIVFLLLAKASLTKARNKTPPAPR